MFVYAQQNLNRPKPWSWTCQETNIKMLEDSCQPKKSTVSFTTITPTASTESMSSQTISQASTALTPKKSSFRKSFMGKFKKDKANNPCYPRFVVFISLETSIDNSQQCFALPAGPAYTTNLTCASRCNFAGSNPASHLHRYFQPNITRR
jgi:hypothetical protein